MLIKKRFIVCIIVSVFMFGLNLVNAETEGCMNKNVSNFEENISLDDNYDDFSFNLEDNYVQNFNDSGFVLNVDNVTMFYRDGSRINVTLKDVNGIPLFNQTVIVSINGCNYTKIQIILEKLH